MLAQIYKENETIKQSGKVLESALIGVISALNSAGEIFDFSVFQHGTWFRPISCWNIFEYRIHSQVYWKTPM